MSFTHATALDGLPSLLAGIYLTWLAFKPIPPSVAEDPVKLRRYMNFKEMFSFAGPGIAIISGLFILAKLTM